MGRYTEQELRDIFYDALDFFNDALDSGITRDNTVLAFFTPDNGLEDPALYTFLKMAFDNLHRSPFWSITPDFIMELGEAYLSLLSHKFLREDLS